MMVCQNLQEINHSNICYSLLIGDCKEPPLQLHPDEINAEAALMQALAECEEDNGLDDGTVEINSDDKLMG